MSHFQTVDCGDGLVLRVPTSDESPWWETHANIATLASYMAHTGHDARAVALAVEKPWNHAELFAEAIADAEQP